MLTDALSSSINQSTSADNSRAGGDFNIINKTKVYVRKEQEESKEYFPQFSVLSEHITAESKIYDYLEMIREKYKGFTLMV